MNHLSYATWRKRDEDDANLMFFHWYKRATLTKEVDYGSEAFNLE